MNTTTFPLTSDDVRVARREDEYLAWLAEQEISEMLRKVLDNPYALD